MAQFKINTTSDEACAALRDEIAGKTIVVTGVSPSSLGADTARAIVAQKPGQLILASQTETKLQEVIESLEVPTGTTVRRLILNLASLESVRRAALELTSSVTAIDAMICTAGIMATSSYQKSEDGFELQFAVNHLGHFHFINQLMEQLLAGHATVVMYTSEAHTRANLAFLEDLTYDDGKSYEKWTAYSNSKICNILTSVGLVKHFGAQGLRSFCVDPGIIVTTSLTRSVPTEEFRALGWIDDDGNLSPSIKTKTSSEGSSTGIIAAFDRSISSPRPIQSSHIETILSLNFTDDHGYFLADGAMTVDGLLPAAVDETVAQRLWSISEELVRNFSGN